MISFRKGYFISAVVLFAILVIIALYVRDQYIRPIGGDLLVVIFLYLLARAFFNFSKGWIALSVLVFAYLIEFAQYGRLVDLLGLTGNRLAEVIIGTTFSWGDMIAYSLGVMVVWMGDQYFCKVSISN